MTKYYIFIRNRFNQVACVGEANEMEDGQIALSLDVSIPDKTTIILTPTAPITPPKSATILELVR